VIVGWDLICGLSFIRFVNVGQRHNRKVVETDSLKLYFKCELPLKAH